MEKIESTDNYRSRQSLGSLFASKSCADGVINYLHANWVLICFRSRSASLQCILVTIRNYSVKYFESGKSCSVFIFGFLVFSICLF